MSKIEEIYQKFNFNCDEMLFQKAIKEYAEHYAQLVISKIKQPENKIYHTETGQRSYVIDDNFKLPEHE